MESTDQSNPESERLEELDAFSILDTPPEINFDQLAQLASAICGTPIALISFIDTDRQWFKSCVGIDLHELPKHMSACNKTISQYDIYEIPDISKASPDESINFMKTEGFNFYAGVPIVSGTGHNVGTLCVIDYVPRTLDGDQKKNLKIISSQIVDLLELRKRYANNLIRLKELSRSSYVDDKKVLDIAHKSSMRGMAELSAGLSYRIKMQMMILENVGKRIENLMENPSKESEVQFKLMDNSIKQVFLIIDSLEKFVLAEQEKWMKPVELCSLIQEVLSHLEHKFKKERIQLSSNLQKDLICVGNETQLIEVIYSVVNNSIEAIHSMKERTIEISLEKKEHYAIIKVKDTGVGISEKVKPFIFQPFFSTKGPNGLGTGLALAELIIHKHSGDIALIHDSQPTIFQISLPVP